MFLNVGVYWKISDLAGGGFVGRMPHRLKISSTLSRQIWRFRAGSGEFRTRVLSLRKLSRLRITGLTWLLGPGDWVIWWIEGLI